MATMSKHEIHKKLSKSLGEICDKADEVFHYIEKSIEEPLDYFRSLVKQIAENPNQPLITKTPKVSRKRIIQKCETIPEDKEVQQKRSMVNDTASASMMVEADEKNISISNTVRKSRREASKKAADIIKEQQSLNCIVKLRRPTEDESVLNDKRTMASNVTSSEDEENLQKLPARPSKQRKVKNKRESESADVPIADTPEFKQPNAIEAAHQGKERENVPLRRSSRNLHQTQKDESKNSEKVNDTLTVPHVEETEASMYEDAIEKSMPIMSSTFTLDVTRSNHSNERPMNATVVLEPLDRTRILNQTVTIQQKPAQDSSKDLPISSKSKIDSKLAELKQTMKNKEFDDLLTDDDSSPERKVTKPKPTKRFTRSSLSTEDEVESTPDKKRLLNNKASAVKNIKSAYKSNVLFSPYAKDSVKKRVEAFEQVGMNSPKLEIEAPVRLTRTKTRAMANANEGTPDPSAATNAPVVSTAQKLARKSLVRALKISRMKRLREEDENDKENAELLGVKTKQQKTTPLSKLRPPMPTSALRSQTPSNSHHPNNVTQSMTAPRGNIATNTYSFLQGPRTVTKMNSVDKEEEKRRRANEEDAIRRREEMLRAQAEEKKRKRQEREIKNKQAREAKEKQEMEKRMKLQKERDEKARLALEKQEKEREELEKRRVLQLQRAQEKEERRRQEELMKQQRLIEQEEMERQLAEQKRREQEAEKRKLQEAKAQQQAAAQILKMKAQALNGDKKYLQPKGQDPASYMIESEPDSEESDDESNPKYPVPAWAKSNLRRRHLEMQSYVPMVCIHKFYDTRRCSPRLEELFEGIDKSRLKRSSSANWKPPPRFSMME